MPSRQLSGINIFAFLAASFMNLPNVSDMQKLWLSFGFALSNAVYVHTFVFSLVNQSVHLTATIDRFSPLAYFSIDTRGRRFLLLLSLVLMLPLLLAAGFSLEIDSNYTNNASTTQNTRASASASAAQVGVFEFFLILYTAAYSPGAGVRD